MSDLSAARAQLEQAIDRLEAALARDRDPADLAEALAEAQAETRRLREAVNAVDGRLDAAIGRLRAVLDADAHAGGGR